MDGFTAPTLYDDPRVSWTQYKKSGPNVWWEVTYSVTNEDDEGHYYTLWDKWGGNLLILGGYPTGYEAGARKEAGDLTLSNAPSFTIDYKGYKKYLTDYGDISGNIVYAAGHIVDPTDGAWMSLHTGDQQEGTNPGKGNSNNKDGKSYDVDIRWQIGWLAPGETQTLTIYLAPGINAGGILQFSSYDDYIVNTGPRVRAYLDEDLDGDPYEDDEFQYSWTWTNKLKIIVQPTEPDPPVTFSSFTFNPAVLNVITLVIIVLLLSSAQLKYKVYSKLRNINSSKISK